MSLKSFLFLPSVKPGNGTGHVQRAFRTAASIRSQAEVQIFIPAAMLRPEFTRLLEEKGLDAEHIITDEQVMVGKSWDFTVWDRRETTREEFFRWMSAGTPIGIDEGGEARQLFPYLIDAFPLPVDLGCSNISDPGFLPQPANRRAPPEHFEKILISFGGEDPAHLTEKAVSWFLSTGRYAPENLTVVLGPLFGERELPDEVGKLTAPDNLAELLAEYDLVCTSFGLTAYEAAAAGTGVILVNPSEYHRTLSRLAGFCEVGIGEIDTRKMEEYLRHTAPRIPILNGTVPSEPQSIGEYLLKLSVPEVKVCPVCGGTETSSALRNRSRTFFECRGCGTVFQMDFGNDRRSYSEEYFFSEYRQQYGRTYLEDFEKIRVLSRSRLRHIRSLKDSRDASLLDAGCAYGPFLKEADEAGYRVAGVDIAESAVAYVRDTLGFSAVCLPFLEFETQDELFDVITMWYVIEHFPDTAAVLKKAADLLKPGGILALSTPNMKGISGRTDFSAFLENSPTDHHIVWSPDIAETALFRHGFTTEKIVITGHHPERFVPFGWTAKGPACRILYFVSRIAGLGDTFEIYARKKGGASRA